MRLCKYFEFSQPNEEKIKKDLTEICYEITDVGFEIEIGEVGHNSKDPIKRYITIKRWVDREPDRYFTRKEEEFSFSEIRDVYDRIKSYLEDKFILLQISFLNIDPRFSELINRITVDSVDEPIIVGKLGRNLVYKPIQDIPLYSVTILYSII